MTAPEPTRPEATGRRWDTATGECRGLEYEARFARRAGSGLDVHGEADLCTTLVEPGARVLDAGCGTGRVSLRLNRLGYRCVGVDRDDSMMARARAGSDEVRWVLADLTDASVLRGLGRFDLVVAAGNVLALLAAGSEPAVIAGLAGALAPGAPFVAGFGLDAAHLPLDRAPFGLGDYDRWCGEAGLTLAARWATWSRMPYDGGGYAVSIHRPADAGPDPAQPR